MALVEIAGGCESPRDIINSASFKEALTRYKKVKALALEEEAFDNPDSSALADIVESLEPEHFLSILPADGGGPETDSQIEEFVREAADSLLAQYGGNDSYSRLRLQRFEVSGMEPESFNGSLAKAAQDHAGLLLQTRSLLHKSHLVEDPSFEAGELSINVHPKITVAEVPGSVMEFPEAYAKLAEIPLTIAAEVRTGADINYQTPANKRTDSWDELEDNPFNSESLRPKEWTAVPLNVGNNIMVVYIHKAEGAIEMEAGLLNLFPIAELEEIKGVTPEAILMFGNPDDSDEQFGFHRDEEAGNMLFGNVPGRDQYKYFGYVKKPLLTLKNCLSIENGEMPLHCGAMRYEVEFDESGVPSIVDKYVVADDMASLSFQEDDGGKKRIYIRGTEHGAFSCTDGFEDNVREAIEAQAVGYNGKSKSNARRVFEVSTREEVTADHQLDLMLYMDNYTLLPKWQPRPIDTSMHPVEAFKHLEEGCRVAAGSTGTDRGHLEYSYMANPFPKLKEGDPSGDGEVVHPYYLEKFLGIWKEFQDVAVSLSDDDELRVGVAKSQMMAGAYVKNGQAEFATAGYGEAEYANIDMERLGPAMLAEDMVKSILDIAKSKREKFGVDGEMPVRLSVTAAFVGDSRTGKSETLEAMNTLLGF